VDKSIAKELLKFCDLKNLVENTEITMVYIS
jgi:hypothetical protein